MVEVQVNRDGRRYPVGWQLPPEQRQRARAVPHTLVCRDQLSIRAAQRVLLEGHAIRRSVGSIFSDLHRFQCSRCRDDS